MYQPVGFVSAGLFVEGVEQLLAGGGAGEEGSLDERAAEEAELALAFGGAVEGDAHAVEQVDDARGPVAHFQDGRLIGEEIAAQNGFIEVNPLAVALLAGDVVAGVDSALGADAVAALDGNHGEEIDVEPVLGELDGAREAREAAADHDHSFRRRGHVIIPSRVYRACRVFCG